MANEALDRITQFATALIEIKANKLKNEIDAYEGAFKEYIRQHSDALLDPSMYSTKEYAPEISGVVKRLVRDTDIDSVSFKTLNDGRLVVTCPKEQEDKLVEIEKKALTIAKSFNTDKETLERLAGRNDRVITTEPGALTNDQTFYMLPELTSAGAFYSLNDDGTISYLESQKANVKAAIGKCAAEMTSEDYDRYKIEFQRAAETYKYLETAVPKLQDNEAIYISSNDKVSDKNAYLIKISNDGISSVRVTQDDEGKTVLRDSPKTMFDDNDLSKVYYKIATVSKPVILTEGQIKEKSPEEIKENTKRMTETIYGVQETKSMDSKLTSFLRRYGNNINLEKGNYVEQIDAAVRDSDNEKMSKQWEYIKTLGDPTIRLTRYHEKEDFLSKQTLDVTLDKPHEQTL